MRMTRSAAAPAAAKTISTKVGPPWCTGAGGELPPPPVPLDECSGGGWVLAGESGAPWDLAGAGGGGGEESLCPDGAGEDEAVGGGDDESADGGGAVEGEGLLFAGDGAAGGLVEELDDMARHDTINLHTLSQDRADALAAARPGDDEEEEEEAAAASRLRPSRSRARTTRRRRRAAAEVQARRARSPGTCTSGHFIHPAAISRGAKNSSGERRIHPHSPLLGSLCCPVFCFCCVVDLGGWLVFASSAGSRQFVRLRDAWQR